MKKKMTATERQERLNQLFGDFCERMEKYDAEERARELGIPPTSARPALELVHSIDTPMSSMKLRRRRKRALRVIDGGKA